MKTKPNEPLNCNNGNGYYNDELNKTHGGVGLTKREYFAALAMQGVLANSYQQDYVNQTPLSLANKDKVAEMAVQQADALIKALNGEQK